MVVINSQRPAALTLLATDSALTVLRRFHLAVLIEGDPKVLPQVALTVSIGVLLVVLPRLYSVLVLILWVCSASARVFFKAIWIVGSPFAEIGCGARFAMTRPAVLQLPEVTNCLVLLAN